MKCKCCGKNDISDVRYDRDGIDTCWQCDADDVDDCYEPEEPPQASDDWDDEDGPESPDPAPAHEPADDDRDIPL